VTLALATSVAELPALPLHTAGKYVAGAYIVLFVLVLVYVAIMALRLTRIQGELGRLLALSEKDEDASTRRELAVERDEHGERESARA